MLIYPHIILRAFYISQFWKGEFKRLFQFLTLQRLRPPHQLEVDGIQFPEVVSEDKQKLMHHIVMCSYFN